MRDEGFTRRQLLQTGLLAAVGTAKAASASVLPVQPKQEENRATWVANLKRVSQPVLQAISEGKLHASMPVEAVPGHEAERRIGSHLEAFARLLAGLAPWLESGDASDPAENELKRTYRKWAQQGIAQAVDPRAPDYMHFGESAQTLVDASFLSLALFRAPKILLESMSTETKAQLVTALSRCRAIQPPFSNWLLFAALNELMLRRLDSDWDRMRVDYALRELNSWYLGDGTYGDGPSFHADFYNSFVMHPYLLQIADLIEDSHAWTALRTPIRERARRYAAIQERLIGSNGEFPVMGRSICYRGGAFHLLADAVRRDLLPHGLEPEAIRGALTAVQKATLDARGTFDEAGWLRIGLAGHQPSLAETYISTGSLYLCSVIWLPLGLPEAHPFWSGPSTAWTQRKVWSGQDAAADHAIDRS